MAAKKRTQLPRATHRGELALGGAAIPCAVLEDGRRVLTERGIVQALGVKPGGRDYLRKRVNSGAGGLPIFLGFEALNKHIDQSLRALALSPIRFEIGIGGNPGHGFLAEALPKICEVWLKAREAGKLTVAQKGIAKKAEILMRGLAHTGIIALVDEATGYQEVRDKKALQAILDKYLRVEYAAWAKAFPDEFYIEMFRLRDWEWKGMKVNRPQVVGTYTNDIVYSRLAPGVLEELRKRNPSDEDTGGRKVKHHQWLTAEVGHPGLDRHLFAVIAFMKASSTWSQFTRSLAKAFPRLGDPIEMELDDAA